MDHGWYGSSRSETGRRDSRGREVGRTGAGGLSGVEQEEWRGWERRCGVLSPYVGKLLVLSGKVR